MSERHDTGDLDPARFDEPDDVAGDIAGLARPGALVLDCDGVLAPLTDHADDSVLLEGVHDLLDRLGAVASDHELTVAVLSGRSLEGLAQFDLPDGLEVLGSYGGERRGRAPLELSSDERSRLGHLDAAAESARLVAGDGAWIERKPASVVLHVRQADPDLGAAALARLQELQSQIDGSAAHHGSNVLEVLARPTDKGTALDALRAEIGVRSMVYLGDDVPDEDAFGRLGDADLGVRIGPGETQATRRLRDPEAVRRMLRCLLDHLEARPD